MKKLFYLVLCFVLVAGSAQAGAVTKSANKDGNAAIGFLPPLPPFPPWASEIKKAVKKSIYFYDVDATVTHGPGLLVHPDDVVIGEEDFDREGGHQG